MQHPHFIDEDGSFMLDCPEEISQLYFPLASETGLKSCVTPDLGGDSKLDQESFLLEPVSIENLHNNRSTRNFWLVDANGVPFSLTGASSAQQAVKFTPEQERSCLTAGFMWHTLERLIPHAGIRATLTSFVPVQDNVEILSIEVVNYTDSVRYFVPYAAVPLYGRSADNLRDHRNVTSMLHRIYTTEYGVVLCPTMSFDERGHRPNNQAYYLLGYGPNHQTPEAFFPTVESFIGEGGNFSRPRAIYESMPGVPANTYCAGRECMGAFRFAPVELKPGNTARYILLLGVENEEKNIHSTFLRYDTEEKVDKALANTRHYWKAKVNISFSTGHIDFDRWMKWVCFQPYLRRLFGCSFLPHHDYGRGGRGWRDLWQDCLSLLLMEPSQVGQMIKANYSGVRIDGTNATIIGNGEGNFIADRNGISRVWMDHALWPQMTTQLYLDQTGDLALLDCTAPYFKDPQTFRGNGIDTSWLPTKGNLQYTESGEIYQGSILEHLLIQQLTAFYDVGEHNLYRLRGADWNDALDMAADRGESVAFTCAYAGNLWALATIVQQLDDIDPGREVELMEELTILLCHENQNYDSIKQKQELLQQYLQSCHQTISGRKVSFKLQTLAYHLQQMATWLTKHLRHQEWIDCGEEGWFNSYYDNDGQPVEGFFSSDVRMMLTGQVFAIMGNVASESQICSIVKSADHYLFRPEIGGYRLNTDFKELKFNLGRMFGFAYGEKENGAVFSHMTVMYANALYRRGFAKEGWKALKTLSDAALHFETSRIYPGIPEYFSSDGRGMYHYLTGAASWFMLTMITQVFGVRGEKGDLVLEPKLVAEQFDENGIAEVQLTFAEHLLKVRYCNVEHKDWGNYSLSTIYCNNQKYIPNDKKRMLLPRSHILQQPTQNVVIVVELI